MPKKKVTVKHICIKVPEASELGLEIINWAKYDSRAINNMGKRLLVEAVRARHKLHSPALPPPLEWEEEAEGWQWRAASRAYSSTEGGLWWRISRNRRGIFRLGKSSPELCAGNTEYRSLDAAKADCAQFDSMAAKARK